MNFYAANAARLNQEYRSVPFEQVHQHWLHLLPKHAALVLDVGAGSGRDAVWFANQGHEVVAVADVKSIHDAMDRREAACYLRRTKEVMLNFPKPQPDGTWKTVKLFKKRVASYTYRRLALSAALAL